LYQGIRITDVPRFVDSHLTAIRNNYNRPVYDVFYQRLVRLKGIISDRDV